MQMISNKTVRIALDERWPRIFSFEAVMGQQRIVGERESLPPRLYIFRKRDRRTLTTDDADVTAIYRLDVTDDGAFYHAEVCCAGEPAAEFDVALRLRGSDLTVAFENVSEHAPYSFVSIRLPHLVSATSRDPDSLLATCGWQGRLLDPKKCKPQLVDYSWVGFTARMCGAAYRPDFMVTLDLPGYEDLMIQEVWQYSRIGESETLASLGAELMHRQRTVESTEPQIKIFPPPDKTPPVVPADVPIQCADRKEVRLRFITPTRGRTLDWTDAAKYFQSLVPAQIRCEPRYDRALVYKIVLAHRRHPYMTFDQALDIIRKVHHLAGGMKQVCYLAYFQHEGGETGYPDMFKVYPRVGDKAMLRRVIREGRKYNAIVSFHQNLDVFDTQAPVFDPDFVARDTLGRMFSAGYWHPTQLLTIAMPAYRKQIARIIQRVVKEYGIRQTYHLDTFSGGPYMFDAHPTRPFNATEYQRGKFAILKEFNRHGIDVTSENLTDPYVGRIGHVWALFNWGTTWEGEEPIPFANFIYHGAISWNSGTAKDEAAILESLIQGGGSSVEFPIGRFNPAEARTIPDPAPWPPVLDNLYLVHPPYMLLRNAKWTGCSKRGSIRRVDYASTGLGTGGRGSYIEVDEAKPGYKVVVGGQLIAKDFATVFPGPRNGTYLAYSRGDQDLNWPAPAGLRDGKVRAMALEESGPGVKVEARVSKGRLQLKLQARQPVLLCPL
jgi:hypothetical protein